MASRTHHPSNSECQRPTTTASTSSPSPPRPPTTPTCYRRRPTSSPPTSRPGLTPSSKGALNRSAGIWRAPRSRTSHHSRISSSQTSITLQANPPATSAPSPGTTKASQEPELSAASRQKRAKSSQNKWPFSRKSAGVERRKTGMLGGKRLRGSIIRFWIISHWGMTFSEIRIMMRMLRYLIIRMLLSSRSNLTRTNASPSSTPSNTRPTKTC